MQNIITNKDFLFFSIDVLLVSRKMKLISLLIFNWFTLIFVNLWLKDNRDIIEILLVSIIIFEFDDVFNQMLKRYKNETRFYIIAPISFKWILLRKNVSTTVINLCFLLLSSLPIFLISTQPILTFCKILYYYFSIIPFVLLIGNYNSAMLDNNRNNKGSSLKRKILFGIIYFTMSMPYIVFYKIFGFNYLPLVVSIAGFVLFFYLHIKKYLTKDIYVFNRD